MRPTRGSALRRLVALAAILSVVAALGDGASAARSRNLAPRAFSQSFYTIQGQPQEITLFAQDRDGDRLSYRVLSEPSLGTLSGSAPSFLYTPSEGATGTDSFRWRAFDGRRSSRTVTTTVLVEPADVVEVSSEPPAAEALLSGVSVSPTVLPSVPSTTTETPSTSSTDTQAPSVTLPSDLLQPTTTDQTSETQATSDTEALAEAIEELDPHLLPGVTPNSHTTPPGCNHIVGTNGSDTLVGTGFCDHIEGLGGSDTIFGLGGNDKLDGGLGNDTIFGGPGNDNISGGEMCPVPIPQTQMTIDALVPLLSGVAALLLDVVCFVMEALITLPAEEGNDILQGGLGDDSVEGGLGNDRVQGNDGNDRVAGGQLNPVLVVLIPPVLVPPLPPTIVLSGPEDAIIGMPPDGNDIVEGNAGNDYVRGRAGNDIANGNAGSDDVDGGSGQDSCDQGATDIAGSPTNCEAIGPEAP